MGCKLCGPKLSLCGLVLSVWGIIQLTLMGVFYYIRAVALLEDVPLNEEGGHSHGIEGFVAMVEAGYTQNAYNCWIAALLYVITLVVSGHQFWMNNRSSVSICLRKYRIGEWCFETLHNTKFFKALYLINVSLERSSLNFKAIQINFEHHKLNMSALFGCGLCCMMLSIWAVIQLFIMGIFFKMEVISFIEEAEPEHHSYEDFDDFVSQTKKNYAAIAVNCWIASVIYALFIALSYLCIRKAKSNDRKLEEKMRDDEYFCSEQAKDPK